jgi:hypothetical protein
MKAKQMRAVSVFCLIVAAAVLASSCARENVIPVGWSFAGSNPENFHVRVSHTDAVTGESCVVLASRAYLPMRPKTVLGFGSLFQDAQAQRYRNKRIAVSALVKSEGTDGWAGIWVSVQGCGKVLAFDNMMSRPIRNTSEWKQYRVVVDVPEEATFVRFGVLLNGPGQVSVDDVRITPVGLAVAPTGWDPGWETKGCGVGGFPHPVNLDFEAVESPA